MLANHPNKVKLFFNGLGAAGANQFLVGPARCADLTPQRGVPTREQVKSGFASGAAGNKRGARILNWSGLRLVVPP
jgi:hypothetical protein